MIYEKSSYTEDNVRMFFIGVRVERERQGLSDDMLFEKAAGLELTIQQMALIERGAFDQVTVTITDAMLRSLATALGYDSPDDVMAKAR